MEVKVFGCMSWLKGTIFLVLILSPIIFSQIVQAQAPPGLEKIEHFIFIMPGEQGV